jgi:uncharacterized protein YdbL (DUF1318 family)
MTHETEQRMAMTRRTMLLAGLALLVGAMSVGAQEQAAQDETQALQERFRERYPALQKHKTAGTVGETFEGYVAVVQDAAGGGAADVRTLVADENRDRKRLYELIAIKEKVDPQIVARRNGVRNFEKAAEGEYLRGEGGDWTQKKAL